MSEYAHFRAGDWQKLQILAHNLQISSEESQNIEGWFAKMLDFQEKLDFLVKTKNIFTIVIRNLKNLSKN